MSRTVGDFLLHRLKDWGVHRIYGYPGDGINGILGALGRAGGDPEFIQVRHEEMSAFMACGHAKFTGEVGVCLATSGPGAIHLLNGLYDAKSDHQPVLAIVGQQPRMSLGGNTQQEVDLNNLFKDVAHEYVHTVNVPEQLPALLDRAVRIARHERTVTCLIVPTDVQELPAKEELPHQFKITPSSLGVEEPRIVPHQESVRKAADILNEGSKVAILVGQGARHAVEEVVVTANLLGAGIAKALLGKDVLPDDLPYVTGSIGLLGTKPSYEMMSDCDTLLMIGSSFPYSDFLPEWNQARGIQIDIDPRMIGIRYPMELNLVGDSRETLSMLIPLLKHKTDRSWRQSIEKNVEEWWKLLEARAHEEADPLNPQRLFWELSSQLPDGCILTSDSGSGTNWYARHTKIRAGMVCSLSGTLATMGSGVPYAIAAKFAHPHRPVVALVGDGAMQMNGMNELLTIAHYWKRWEDPRFIVLVLHNNDLNQVTWEMRAMQGDPKFETSQDLPDFDYASFAELTGLQGVRVDNPDQVRSTWERAFAADRPVVIDAIVDPNVPPLPPYTSFDQARKMITSLLKGDTDRAEVIRHIFKGKIKEYLPSHR